MSWFTKKAIVVPVDFSDQSLQAVDEVLTMADSPSNVHVIHVLPDTAAVIEVGVAMVGDFPDDQRRAEMIQTLEQTFSDEKYRSMKFAVEVGDPGSRIAAFAADSCADLIVLPSHGLTGLKRLLLGSVAERVCRLSHCPVLVLKH